ncbi:MAG: 2,3-bisphosphoglycerate-dependent phosphoglycerate mutase [Solirubrobacterales bacterium]|jgi:broad specificity phosphatase PhoE|nr:2,3-bisphosphoglycerate-dependent phosphoglycerate mutase [Solirubrobacterales bacterium]
MRALLLRHGESVHNASRSGEPAAHSEGDRLTEKGVKQAHAAGEGLREHGVTRLMTSPLRRARETAEAVAEALGLEPEEIDYTGELTSGETFEQAVERVRRLKAELESGEADELPLLVTHGIFARFFLLDSVLGERFEAPMAAGIWNLGSHNCGLSTFAHGESRDPLGAPISGWTCLTWMERPWSRP